MAKRIMERFSQLKIAVLGDVMIDQYIIGKVERISPEAPVPVLNVSNEYETLGGAANVANNISSLGAKVKLFSVVGKDPYYEKLKKCLNKANISHEYLLRDSLRPTIVKTRLLAHHQQVVRVDRENKETISPAIEAKMISMLEKEVRDCQALIISDYRKGVVSESLVRAAIDLCKKNNIIILTDPKVENFSLYNGSTVITPNHREAGLPYHRDIHSEKDLIDIGNRLLKDFDFQSVVITRGEQGMTLFHGDDKFDHIPTAAKEVYDVSGAGDTVIGILGLGLAAGLSLTDAAKIANYAAGVVVSKLGTAVVKPQELIAELEKRFG